jgi:hypothetical protein
LNQPIKLLNTDVRRQFIVGTDDFDVPAGNAVSVFGESDLETAIYSFARNRINAFVGKHETDLQGRETFGECRLRRSAQGK